MLSCGVSIGKEMKYYTYNTINSKNNVRGQILNLVKCIF